MGELHPARERLLSLLDPNSFVEILASMTSRSTDYNTASLELESDGVIVGHGTIDGRPVFVFSQDEKILAGSVGEMHAHKIRRVYAMAMKCKAPVVGMIASSGVRLQESFDALESVGGIYRTMAKAKGKIPQILGVFGKCGGGLSVLAGLSDFCFMSEDSRMFVNTPDALKNNFIGKNDTSAPAFQYASGNADAVGSGKETIRAMKQVLSFLPTSSRDGAIIRESRDDINRITKNLEEARLNINDFLTEISDQGEVFYAKKGFAEDMACGFIRLDGITAGFVANDAMGSAKDTPRLSVGGCEKAARFVDICGCFNIPVISFVNVKGFASTVGEEERLNRAIAGLVSSFVRASVPKLTFIIKKAEGSAYLAMNARSVGADLVYAYPDIDFAIMDPKMVAKVMVMDLPGDENMIAGDYTRRVTGANNAAKHGYIDKVIDFKETRKYLIDALQMLLWDVVEAYGDDNEEK